jgi:hypothetical protein
MSDTKHAQKIHVITKSNLNHESGWHVTLFDCYCHTYDEACNQLVEAIGCSSVTSMRYADLVQQFGSAVVFHGLESECERVAQILGATGLTVEVGV